MNTKVKQRDELADARRIVRSWSQQEFEEMRTILGLTRSREELLRVQSTSKAKSKHAGRKK